MEAWIVTDRDALRSFYGPRWVEKCLPSLTRTESVSPKELVKALENASRATQKGSYHKITHASRLLKLVKPSIVREHSASCRLFFECLEKRV
jgi:hypothetical protein